MRINGYFVTGTDTGVGKTFVTASLAAAFRAQGRRVLACKPVESGAGDDAARIAAAAGHDSVCLYRFDQPLAPGVAAEQAAVTIDLGAIRDAIDRAVERTRADLILVEAAGGLLCPMGDLRTMADLAALLGWPLLIVARSGLGTINHTLLTIAEARRRGLPIAGVILNQASSERTPDEASNPRLIERLADVRVLATFAHGATGAPPELLQLAT